MDVRVQPRVDRFDAVGELHRDLGRRDRTGPDSVGERGGGRPAQFGISHSYSLGPELTHCRAEEAVQQCVPGRTSRMAESKKFPSAVSEDIPVQLTLERPARLRPGHLWVPARILTFVVWIGAAIMLAFGFIPGLFTPVESSLYDGQLPFNYSPI